MRKLPFFLILLVACNSEKKPPHTSSEYDSILNNLVRERDSVIRGYVKAGDDSAGFRAGRKYAAMIDSVGKEKFEYYHP